MGALFTPGYTVDETVTVDASVTVDTEDSFYPTIPPLSATDFAARLLSLYPRGWVGDAAKNPGGVAYALFEGIGATLASFLSQMQFIANGLRIKLAYGTALDTISVDYFGVDGLPRNPGESDTSFRARILQMLLIARVTRAAIQNVVEIVTGASARVGEPWTAGGDCAAYDVNSYYDVDGAPGVAPSRIGDGLAYTGFVDATIPVSSVTGGYPIYGVDMGLAFDVGTSAYDLASYATNVLPNNGIENQVISFIQAFKAWGIVVGIRFTASAALANTLYGYLSAFSGEVALTQQNEGVTFSLQSWLQTFGIWVEVLPWVASSYLSVRGVSFEITTSSAPAQTYTIGYIAAIFKGPQPLALRVPVKPGQSTLSCTLAIPAGTIPLLTPDWNTIPYITSLTPASMGIGVSNPGSGNLDLIFVPGESVSVTTGMTNFTVTATLPSNYRLFATPSWATTMSVTKASGSFTLTFGTAAPSGAVVYWSAS